MPMNKHPRRSLLCIFVALAVIAAFILVSVAANIFTKEYTVIINDDGNVRSVKTRETNVGEILLQAEIEVGEQDYINVGLDYDIEDELFNINIKRAVPVKVVLADKTLDILTVEDSLRYALEENDIELSELDKLIDNTTGKEISRYEEIEENMEVRLVDMEEKIIEENTVLPYEIITKENEDLEDGKTRIVQDGQTGNMVTTYKVLYEDGQEIQKQKIGEVVESKPVNEIKEVGTLYSFTTSRGSKVNYNDSYILQATAYTASSCGKSKDHPLYGITATGMRAKVGVVAVDKDVIPLGTKLYVESLDSTKDYGYCIAVDTGVFGKKIDLYFNTVDECFQFGRRNVRVYVLKDQSIDVFAMR